jgi:2-keto-3-deoxy-L-rhamnonate aldolase RhmA
MVSEGGARSPAWAHRRNRFKEALADGRPAVAMWVTTPWIGTIEVLGASGADAAFIDLEHVSYGLAEAERLIVSCEAAGISPIVRPSGIDPDDASRILDAGAHGLIFPQVETEEQARLAVSCLRYAPAGARGWGGAHTRHAVWDGGYSADFFAGRLESAGVYSREYVEKAESDAIAIMLVETVRGVENIDAIVSVPGVNAVIFGWGDYSVEVGFDAAACRAAAAKVYAACKQKGIGLAVSPGDEFFPGCFAIAGADSMHMSGALRAAVERAKADLG